MKKENYKIVLYVLIALCLFFITINFIDLWISGKNLTFKVGMEGFDYTIPTRETKEVLLPEVSDAIKMYIVCFVLIGFSFITMLIEKNSSNKINNIDLNMGMKILRLILHAITIVLSIIVFVRFLELSKYLPGSTIDEVTEINYYNFVYYEMFLEKILLVSVPIIILSLSLLFGNDFNKNDIIKENKIEKECL